MKKTLALLILPALFFSVPVSSAAAAGPADTPSCTVTVTEETNYCQIAMNITIDDFNRLGFRYGDSCDILFADGKLLKDVPYYNGYYSRTGEPLIVSYPGNSQVQIAVCNGDPSWTFYGCREGDTITVTLAEAGKYIDVQNALDTVYSNNREDYPDDCAFANFRAISGGRMKKGVFWRGASPVNNACSRAGVVDRLIRNTGIRFVLDLADTEEKVIKYAEESRPEYFLSLYGAGLVAPLGLNASFTTEAFRSSLVSGLREMMKHEGPYYIHCLEGKDRTGFVCMLLEALCGADGAELEADYMKTYENYYGIVPGSRQYDAILDVKYRDLLAILNSLGGSDPEAAAKAFLYQGGMTEKEIEDLTAFLTV